MAVRSLRTVAFAFAGAVLGILLAVGIYWLVLQGYWVQWHTIPRPPEPVVGLELGWLRGLYAQTETGAAYRCNYSPDQNECWEGGAAATAGTGVLVPRQPCDTSGPEFSWMAGPPREPADCVQFTWPCVHCEDTEFDCVRIAGRDKLSYVLDQNGEVWRWSHKVCVHDNMLALALLAASLVAAGVGGAVGYHRPSRREARQDATLAE